MDLRRAGVGIASVFFAWLCWLCLSWHGQRYVYVDAVSLPLPTSTYYTVVSAGFGSLQFSQHYEEYENSAQQVSQSIGRYYAPSTAEWTDVINGNYFLQFDVPGAPVWYEGAICKQYPLVAVSDAHLVQGATALLVSLNAANVSFINAGLTTSVRSQSSVHYVVSGSWRNGGSGAFSSVDQFVQLAFATGGAVISMPYAVSVSIDVFYVSDSAGTLKVAGDGFIPLRYSISGSFTDAHATRPLNIVYDFMQFAALDSFTIGQNLATQYLFSCVSAAAGAFPPAIALPVSVLPAMNSTIPDFGGGGRAMLELTASNTAAMQIHALLKSTHGQELLIFLEDANAFAWSSSLYEYDRQDDIDLLFANGAVYTLNDIQADLYYEIREAGPNPSCTAAKIGPSNVSPIQWLHGGGLNTLFANQAQFFSNAQPTGRKIIKERGITTDTWTVNNQLAYNGNIYDFNMTMYVTANGWTNMGRSITSLAPQLIRLAYSGTRYPATGSPSSYTLQFDFFMQHAMVWSTQQTENNNPFDPVSYGCSPLSTSESILPPMPTRFTVSVNQVSYQLWSAQYTMYVDTVRNMRRIDGMFTGPNTFAVVANGNNGGLLNILEWTQNVSLPAGFSTQTLSFSLPYTSYQATQMSRCDLVNISANYLIGENGLDIFQWVAQADASEAMYVESGTVRGMNVDKYEVALTTGSGSSVQSTYFEMFYLSKDETEVTIPVSAKVSVNPFFHYYPGAFGYPTVQYQFYNFRSSVPTGIFTSPARSACLADGQPPAAVTPLATYDRNPTLDGTPQEAPVWPAAFSMMIEGVLLESSGDLNVYIFRWYADFANFRERVDIEPAFALPLFVNGKPPVSLSHVYYYNKPTAPATAFSFTDGTHVTYSGGKQCTVAPITADTMNPLKKVGPGNLFDTFFPATTQTLSAQSRYNLAVRQSDTSVDGIFVDQYDWTLSATLNGSTYTGKNSIQVSIPEWQNNPQAGVNYTLYRIPLAIIANAAANQNGNVRPYNPIFRTTHYQPNNPGTALFDAQLFGCATTPDSPWYNIYGIDLPASPAGSSSTNTSLVAGVVVGVVAVIILVFGAYYWWRRGSPAGGVGAFLKKFVSVSARGGGQDNELAGMGAAKALKDEPEHSLNAASLNKEPALEVEHTDIVLSAAKSAEANTDNP